MKLFCTQVVNHLLGGSIDYDKVQTIMSGAEFGGSDVKVGSRVLFHEWFIHLVNDINEKYSIFELKDVGTLLLPSLNVLFRHHLPITYRSNSTSSVVLYDSSESRVYLID